MSTTMQFYNRISLDYYNKYFNDLTPEEKKNVREVYRRNYAGEDIFDIMENPGPYFRKKYFTTVHKVKKYYKKIPKFIKKITFKNLIWLFECFLRAVYYAVDLYSEVVYEILYRNIFWRFEAKKPPGTEEIIYTYYKEIIIRQNKLRLPLLMPKRYAQVAYYILFLKGKVEKKIFGITFRYGLIIRSIVFWVRVFFKIIYYTVYGICKPIWLLGVSYKMSLEEVYTKKKRLVVLYWDEMLFFYFVFVIPITIFGVMGGAWMRWLLQDFNMLWENIPGLYSPIYNTFTDVLPDRDVTAVFMTHRETFAQEVPGSLGYYISCVINDKFSCLHYVEESMSELHMYLPFLDDCYEFFFLHEIEDEEILWDYEDYEYYVQPFFDYCIYLPITNDWLNFVNSFIFERWGQGLTKILSIIDLIPWIIIDIPITLWYEPIAKFLFTRLDLAYLLFVYACKLPSFIISYIPIFHIIMIAKVLRAVYLTILAIIYSFIGFFIVPYVFYVVVYGAVKLVIFPFRYAARPIWRLIILLKMFFVFIKRMFSKEGRKHLGRLIKLIPFITYRRTVLIIKSCPITVKGIKDYLNHLFQNQIMWYGYHYVFYAYVSDEPIRIRLMKFSNARTLNFEEDNEEEEEEELYQFSKTAGIFLTAKKFSEALRLTETSMIRAIGWSMFTCFATYPAAYISTWLNLFFYYGQGTIHGFENRPDEAAIRTRTCEPAFIHIHVLYVHDEWTSDEDRWIERPGSRDERINLVFTESEFELTEVEIAAASHILEVIDDYIHLAAMPVIVSIMFLGILYFTVEGAENEVITESAGALNNNVDDSNATEEDDLMYEEYVIIYYGSHVLSGGEQPMTNTIFDILNPENFFYFSDVYQNFKGLFTNKEKVEKKKGFDGMKVYAPVEERIYEREQTVRQVRSRYNEARAYVLELHRNKKNRKDP